MPAMVRVSICAQWQMVAAGILLTSVRVVAGVVHRLAAHSSVAVQSRDGAGIGSVDWGGAAEVEKGRGQTGVANPILILLQSEI
jgi:hypothetical protein